MTVQHLHSASLHVICHSHEAHNADGLLFVFKVQTGKSRIQQIVIDSVTERTGIFWDGAMRDCCRCRRRHRNTTKIIRTKPKLHSGDTLRPCKRVIWFYYESTEKLVPHTSASAHTRRWHTNICQSNKIEKQQKRKNTAKPFKIQWIACARRKISNLQS